MTDQDNYGISTSLFARAAATADTQEPDEDNDESIEVPADKEGTHPARPEIRFQRHRQAGNREVVRGLPANLKTSPLGPRRPGRRGE